MDCIFCSISNGNIHSDFIYEDDAFVVIMDKFPVNLGHCLVIPKKHVQNIFEIDNELSAKAFTLATKIAKAVSKTLGVKDINIIQNNGDVAGQSVNHFHVHVIPRYINDGMEIKFNSTEPTPTEVTSFLSEVKKFL